MDMILNSLLNPTELNSRINLLAVMKALFTFSWIESVVNKIQNNSITNFLRQCFS